MMAMEKLIIEQLKQGNEDAFKYIYKQHYVLLCRFANQMLADAALAEEIVDDVIFYLWEHWDDIEIEYVAMFMNITRLIGDTHKRYWISEYSKLCIPIPPKEEQKRIINAANAMFEKLDAIIESL